MAAKSYGRQKAKFRYIPHIVISVGILLACGHALRPDAPLIRSDANQYGEFERLLLAKVAECFSHRHK